MTVAKAKELLENLKTSGGDAINETFKSHFVSKALPEAPIMEFSPILMHAPHNNLRLLSNMFNTQLKIHFVQLHLRRGTVDKPETRDNVKSRKKNRKQKASKDSMNTLRTKRTRTLKNVEREFADLEIVQRSVLQTIVLDQLTEPTWEVKNQDFIWTQSGLKRGENLKDMFYVDDKLPEKKKKGLEKFTGAAREPNPLPEELTVQFGISLKRTQN